MESIKYLPRKIYFENSIAPEDTPMRELPTKFATRYGVPGASRSNHEIEKVASVKPSQPNIARRRGLLDRVADLSARWDSDDRR